MYWHKVAPCNNGWPSSNLLLWAVLLLPRTVDIDSRWMLTWLHPYWNRSSTTYLQTLPSGKAGAQTGSIHPVLSLGQRANVELGVRQLRRAVPLQTTQLAGLPIATAGEMLRIKGFLLAQRRATRDFVDVTALAQHLGHAQAIEELRFLNLVYGALHTAVVDHAFC